MSKTAICSYLLLSALVPLSNAQLAPKHRRLQAPPAPPKVVFIGDFVTHNWASAFAANPNWINKGVNGTPFFSQGSVSYGVLADFQSEVVSLHPAVVHIMIGLGDSDKTADASFRLAVPDFGSDLEAIVQEAKGRQHQGSAGTGAEPLGNYGTA
jgi:hypothetical protein